jgi:hypothetical protein
MNFIEPAHLQGVMKGLFSSSESSKHILQAFPDSKPPNLVESFKLFVNPLFS